MNQQLNPVTSTPRPMGLGGSLLWLTFAVIAALPLYAGFGMLRFGSAGVVAAGIAALTCWAGAALALFWAAALQAHSPIGGLLSGMFFRMGLPLAVGGVLHFNVPELARANIFLFVLAYYLLTLVVETLLAVRLIPGGQRTAKSS